MTKGAIIAGLGGEERLSTLERLQAENAAMASAVLRDMQVRWLQGEEMSVTEMVSIENVFNRTAAVLGTKRWPNLTYLAKEAKDDAVFDAQLQTLLGGGCQSTPATRKAERKRVPEMEASYLPRPLRQREEKRIERIRLGVVGGGMRHYGYLRRLCTLAGG